MAKAPATYDYNAEWKDIPGQEYVKKLTDDAEAAIQQKKLVLLLLYSRSCAHCAKVKPHFAAAGQELATKGSRVRLAAIEIVNFPALASKYSIRHVPEIFLFRNGKMDEVYQRPKTTTDFVAYALKLAVTSYDYNAEWKTLQGQEYVAKLDEDGEAYIQKKKAVLLLFYSRTCLHCAKVKPHFAAAGQELATKESRVRLATVELVVFPELASKYSIRHVPEIYLFRNGKMDEEYKGPKTTTDFVAYALKVKV